MARDLSEFLNGEPRIKALPTEYGGTGDVLTVTTGDILVGRVTNSMEVLGAGASGTVLTIVDGMPSWASATTGSGGVNSATYFVLSSDATLTDERILTFNSSNFTTSDGGAGLAYSVNTIQDIRVDASPTFSGMRLSSLSTGFAKFDGTGIISSVTPASTDISDFNEAVDDRVDALIQDGTGLAWTYSDVGNTLTGNVSLSAFSTTNLSEGTNLYFTDERAQDAVGTIFVDSSKIDFTYSDATPSITATIVADSLVNADINTAAAIARSKLAVGTADHVVINSGTGAFSSEANLAVSRGGTGLGTLTANNVILGNGTTAVQFVAPSTSGNVLTSNGTTWTSAAPAAASVAIGSTVTGGDDNSILFINPAATLAEDADFTFEASTNTLSVPIIDGGTASMLGLNDKLSIYDSQGNISSSEDTVMYDPSFSATAAAGSVVHSFFNYMPTYSVAAAAGAIHSNYIYNANPMVTFTSGLAYIYYAFYHQGTFTVNANAGFAATYSLFVGAPIIQSSTIGVNVWGVGGMYQSIPTQSATSGGSNGTTFLDNYIAANIVSVTNASTTLTTSRNVGFSDAPQFKANTASSALTVTVRRGVWIKNPSYTTTGTVTVTDNTLIEFDDQSASSGNLTVTNMAGIKSALTSGTNRYFINATGDAQSFHRGNFRIGQVSATASELQFANASNANITAFKAGVATAGVTYTLPTADGSANQVLKTNGSGTLSWTTAAGSSPLTTKGDIFTFSTVDARLAVGTNDYFLVADSAETTGLRWNGRVKAKTTSDSAGKTSDATITSADTVAELACTLVTGKKYKITGLLMFSSGNTTPNAKMQFRDDGALVVNELHAVLSYGCTASTTTADNINASVTGVNTDSTIIEVAATGRTVCSITGYVDVTTGGTLDIAWAQNTSNANAVVLETGSWIHYEEI